MLMQTVHCRLCVEKKICLHYVGKFRHNGFSRLFEAVVRRNCTSVRPSDSIQQRDSYLMDCLQISNTYLLLSFVGSFRFSLKSDKSTGLLISP